MTIEERNTAKAIQDIAKTLRKPDKINWEQRRYEAASAAMQGLLNATSVERFTLRIKPSVIAQCAVEYADALIEELKKGEE